LRDNGRDALRLRERGGAHRLRLPRLAIVAVHLQVTYRLAKARTSGMTHGEQRDLVIELHPSFHDHSPAASTTAFLSVTPRRQHIVPSAHDALSFAGRAHHGLDHTRHADSCNGALIFVLCAGESVR